MPTHAERRAATREKLIEAAREHFASNGYESTHTNDILEQAGFSRGAMYHHFENKEALFEAVFVAVSDQTIARATQVDRPIDSPLEHLIESCMAWLRAVRKPETAAILLDQGPMVLGWKRARDLEAKTGLGLMQRSLEAAVAAGEVEVESTELAARMINALLAEAALATLYKQPRVSIAKQESLLRAFISGLTI